MSFKLFTDHLVQEEVLDMVAQLKTTPGSYAISDLPKQIIKEYANRNGYKVSTRTTSYGEVRVTLL